MSNASDSTNIIQRNNTDESPLSPTASIEFLGYGELPIPVHTQRISNNSMESMRGNEFREILNTAVQATQPDRQMQRQSEVLGKYLIRIFVGFYYIHIFLC